MNWFDTSGLTNLAKTALKEAQKTIDKALDIQDESGEEQEAESPPKDPGKPSPSKSTTPQNDNSDFFSSWGLTVSAESSKDVPIKEQPVVTESPSKANSQSLWGSFAGSFFEQPKSDDSTIVQPPKAKSMNVISDAKYGSQDDLFSKSQLVMSDGVEGLDFKVRKSSKDDFSKDERRGSSRSNRLSLVSSRNSSDSVEVLSQSLKTTPDSEAASGQSISHSSSIGQKLNSESVEILPDSLVSPSSIECLGFDSYSSGRNSSSSSMLSPGDVSDKKSTPVGDRSERADTADSVSLVADDDEDTMSYNSISECTAPTVLDTDDKAASPFPKIFRSESRKIVEKDFIHLEQSVLPPRMQISENSSNDGSWSDRTLNADNDSINLDNAIEESKKETEQEDILIEKLSDSSSFYNVNVSGEMLRSESSAFVNVEKQQCSGPESEASLKDSSIKERTSPISSDSKSDLVKIGSDRTSGHTSGDELETTTSSDIEIIPSPNGDNGHGFCRSSPAKYGFKQSKLDGTTSPNLVDLVLGKSLATKIRGHNRELSEASVQSNTSDESQSSENERLMRRLCEMAEILEARENRLMEVSRSNAELAESNTELKGQLEALAAKQEGGDINMITEDYTQRMSALEKKFQQAIREKDQLRKQIDTMKLDSSRKNSSELEDLVKEKDEVISQLQEEGEKLARQQLQHSNIIKKLRAKEKENEQLIKNLKDKVAEQTSEMERLKRSIAAKEELEVNQIEAVYRLTTANKKLEAELVATKDALDDATQRLESSGRSLEAARASLTSQRAADADLTRMRRERDQHARDAARHAADAQRHAADLHALRAEMLAEERRWARRLEELRREVREVREAREAREGGAGAGGEAEVPALLAQVAALQRARTDSDAAHAHHTRQLQRQLEAHEASLAKAEETSRALRAEAAAAAARAAAAEAERAAADTRRDDLAQRCTHLLDTLATLQRDNAELISEAEKKMQSKEAEVAELTQKVRELTQHLDDERSALDTEKKRNTILQEQMMSRGDISPPHSVASDSFSSSMWPLEEGSATPVGMSSAGAGGAGATGMVCAEEALWALTRRAGEQRALAAQLAQALAERNHAAKRLAALQAKLTDYQSVQEQYDALLQMYGEKEEQLSEARLDLHDVTQLYKAQLDELVQLKQHAARR